MMNDDIKATLDSMADEIAEAINKAKDTVDAAARSGYLGDLYRTRYTVTGRGAFPMDMLRYAVSWPNDEQDGLTIEESLEFGGGSDQFTVRLCKYHRDANPNLCEDRWESKFRWKVLHVDSDANRIETMRI